MATNKSIRKREVRTSQEQYECYLAFMETDRIFRTGTINPNVEDNCIPNKWMELTEKLNACGSGPKFDVENWKKVVIKSVVITSLITELH